MSINNASFFILLKRLSSFFSSILLPRNENILMVNKVWDIESLCMYRFEYIPKKIVHPIFYTKNNTKGVIDELYFSAKVSIL